ncbi:Carboxyl-terminal protease [hydrothermal vent metagenome]|uniref:Carboxyl-terminal protease n=1 Tax=hydrothermal vent metagenome TaxID=652676 RepID=A0A3B0TU62_9ZZZZ
MHISIIEKSNLGKSVFAGFPKAKLFSSVRRISLICVSSLMLTLAPVNAFAQSQSSETLEESVARSPDEVYSYLRLFGEVFDRIREEYVDVPDEKELIQAAIDGMLSSLDPHSGYLTPQNRDAVMQDTTGEFGGLGIELTMQEGVVKVIAPIPDTPAERAGLLADDFIIKLDGKAILGQGMDATISQMRGIVGEPITVTVVRRGVAKPFDVTLNRDRIPLRAVRWLIEKDVGIMRLDGFSGQAFPGIQDAINGIIEEREGVLPLGLVLDLRNNPGGLVDQAVQIVDAFLSRGAILLTRGRTELESARYDAQPDDLDKLVADIPLIVLINGGSASASEIVAGALQDQGRATIVGTRSFGKGSVQLIISLGPNGAMRLTTSRYYTPSNRSIQAVGIRPDIEIFQDVPLEFEGRDEIVGEAALDGQIGGGSDDEATTGSSVFVPRDRSLDTQLNYAIDLILGNETNEAFPPDPNG